MCPPCEEQRRQHQHCRKAATDGTGHAEISMLAAVHTVKKCRRLGVGVGGFDGENTGLSTSLIPRPPGSTSGGSGRPDCRYSGCAGPGCARSEPHLTRQMTAVSQTTWCVSLPSSLGYSPRLRWPLVRGARKATVSRPRQRAPAPLSRARQRLPAAERMIRIAAPSARSANVLRWIPQPRFQLLRSLLHRCHRPRSIARRIFPARRIRCFSGFVLS